MTLDLVLVGAAVVVSVAGDVDVLTAPRLRDAVREALDYPEGHEVVVDLTAVTFLGSSGLGALVAAARSAARRRQPLRVVVDHSRPVIRPLQAAGLDELLTLDRRLDEALPPASEPTF